MAKAPNRVHTITHAWSTAFLDHPIGSDDGYACLLAFGKDRLIRVMPVLVSAKYFSLLTKSEVCPPTSRQTFACDLICRANDADNIVNVMVQALDRFLPPSREVEFHHLSECSPVVRCFSNRASRPLSNVEFDGYGNVVCTSGSYQHYLESLGPKFARNLKRVERKVRSLDGDGHNGPLQPNGVLS